MDLLTDLLCILSMLIIRTENEFIVFFRFLEKKTITTKNMEGGNSAEGFTNHLGVDSKSESGNSVTEIDSGYHGEAPACFAFGNLLSTASFPIHRAWIIIKTTALPTVSEGQLFLYL